MKEDAEFEPYEELRTPDEEAFFSSRGEQVTGELAKLLESSRGPAADQLQTDKTTAAVDGADRLDRLKDRQDQLGTGKTDPVPAVDQQADQQGKQGDKPGYVPVNALHEERERRKALETELSTFRERFARADERQRAINELLGLDPEKPAQQQAQPKQPIDPEKDIFGAFRQQQEVIADLQKQLQSTGQRFEQQTAEQRILSEYAADARRFSTETPDFPAAYNHLLSVRDRELQALGVTDATERGSIIAREEKQIASQALTQKRSPAQIIYELAKVRGFAPKSSAQPSAAIGASSAATQVSDAVKQLEAAQKGREAFPTLTGAGSTGASGLTVQALADMSEEEFERTTSKLSGDERRRLLGG
jgi:hypothetical protein